jgi:DNA-binding transcriptional LysR family regulator
MDMKRTDLPLLMSLDALLTELNVTRAAKRMNVSQSTLSGHLSRLRDVFQDALLVPSETGRGMVPTERALALQPRLAEALMMLRHLAAEPLEFDPTRSSRTFVLAAKDTVFSVVGLDVMAEVMRQGNPALRMAVVPPSDVDLVERMARGDIDLYVCDIAKMPATLRARSLLKADFALAQRRSHPRGLHAPDLEEYCGLDHVIVSERADFSTPIDEALLKLGHRRVVVTAVPSYNQVALLLSQTNGVATLPRPLLKRYEGLLDLVELPFPMPQFRLAMAWHPRVQDDQAVAWLRGCFLKMQGLSAEPA